MAQPIEVNCCYTPDVFYDINLLRFATICNLLLDAKRCCYEWHVDKLDCKVSFQRKRQPRYSWKKAMMLAQNSPRLLFTFIYRRGFQNRYNKWHGELGFRTMTDPDYFLYVNIADTDMYDLIRKYNLQETN